MSVRTAGAVPISHDKNAGAPVMLMNRDQQGNDQRKFGYKTRKLRYPIRQTDDEEALIQMEIARNEDKKKFNKNNKDFIRNNKERFLPKDQSQQPPLAGSTHIKPGTVTLTQEQLATLLASLGKTVGKDNPIKISIDSSNNNIEVENLNSKEESELQKYKSSGQGIERNEADRSRPMFDQLTGNPDQHSQSLDDRKQETEIGGETDGLSWKHMTMGERKRLQWARERAESHEEYNPWGKPGAGAPMHKIEDEPKLQGDNQSMWNGSHVQSTSKSNADRKQKQDLIEKEIEALQKVIRETEQMKLEEEFKALKATKPDKRQEINVNKVQKQATKKREEENNESFNNQGILALDNTSNLSKKEMERKNWIADLDKQRDEHRLRKQQEKARDQEGIHDKFADRFVSHKPVEHVSPKHQPSAINLTSHSTKDICSATGKTPESNLEMSIPPAAMRSAIVTGAGTLNEARYDNVRSEEKRRWLEELDQQREAQRLAKMAQKEKDKQDAGIWTDKYPVDHQKLRQANEILQSQTISPRTNDYVTTQRNSGGGGASVAQVQDTEESSVIPPSFLRGQGVFVDPVTRKEQEEKRRIQMEYQAQVKTQIEEKDRLKRESRERKMREDMEEERRLQMERDSFNRQLEMEQGKNRAREEQRQKQLDQLKYAVEEAQEKAQEEKNVKRIHHLMQRGHDISQLKATYEASLPIDKKYDPPTTSEAAFKSTREYQPNAAAPSLYSTYNIDLDTLRNEPNFMQEYGNAKSNYRKDPYIEDRLLTPSSFRNPSKPYDDPDSPRRDFGTQTLVLKDLQAILQSLPNDVQIQYKMKVEEALQEKEKQKQAPSRKVHPKQTEENREHSKSTKEVQPSENTERPLWNQRKRKTVKKNSEKDPFYNEKKREAEVRREKREKQLLYLQELNRERIPSHAKIPGRIHCESLEDVRQMEERSRKVAPSHKTHTGSHIGPHTGHHATGNNQVVSPNILSLLDDVEKKPSSRANQNTGRSSPPVPAVRHRGTGKVESDKDPYQYANNYLQMNQSDTSKYGDTAIVSPGDEFMPFMRTTEILDPSKADEPVAVSRENSRAERARNAYYGTHHPANKGKKLDVYRDYDRETNLKDSQNPIFHPGLVSDHPTARQELILKQLSSLKQTLKQRQRELEDHMSPSDMQDGAGRS